MRIFRVGGRREAGGFRKERRTLTVAETIFGRMNFGGEGEGAKRRKNGSGLHSLSRGYMLP